MSVERPLPQNDLQFVLREAAELWPQLAGARVFVTGATGFFGRWMLESLFFADAQYGLDVRVTALSRDPEAFLRRAPHLGIPRLSWIRGSVSSLRADDFDGTRFDAVIHLATEADMQASSKDPNAALSVIADGTKRVLHVAARTGARRFLFTSSGAVYSRQSGSPNRLSEQDARLVDPNEAHSVYALPGHAKLQAEHLCAEYARRDGLGAVIARGFSFAGPCLPLDSKFAFGNFIRDGLRGGPIVLKGSGTSVRSYLYAADLAVWLWSLLLRGVPGRAYNVGSENPVTLLALAKVISSELGASGVSVQHRPLPDGVMDSYVPSTQRARHELGLSENFTLPEMIRRTAAWNRPPVKH